jgi:hypothetical protein
MQPAASEQRRERQAFSASRTRTSWSGVSRSNCWARSAAE